MEPLKLPILPAESLRYFSRAWTAKSSRRIEQMETTLCHGEHQKPLVALSGNVSKIKIHEPVKTYRELLELIARIASLNPGYQLYYRGQTNNHNDGKFDRTLFPSMWHKRMNDQAFHEVRTALVENGNLLAKEYSKWYPQETRFAELLQRDPRVRWALLQHYGVCGTPLLDVTRNLQVACTFARAQSISGVGYIYILGLPYLRESIMTDSAEGLSILSLTGVTPPSARRPLNQDGYLLSSSDWWRYTLDPGSPDSWNKSNRPDFSSRLIAAFAITTDDSFYENSGLSDLDNGWLFPREDEFAAFLKAIGLTPKY